MNNNINMHAQFFDTVGYSVLSDKSQNKWHLACICSLVSDGETIIKVWAGGPKSSDYFAFAYNAYCAVR